MNTDPIADMLTRLRNAHRAKHHELKMPYSKIKYAMLQVMAKNRFIEEVNIENSGKFQELHVILANRDYPMETKRISKPGQRIYTKAGDIPAVMSGLGITILSTPQGVMSGKDAKAKNLGGEVICQLW